MVQATPAFLRDPDRSCGSLKTGLMHHLNVAHRQWAHETAAEVMRAAGFEPVGPYPGLAKAPWQCRCTRCGGISSPTLTNIRQGGGCRSCAGQAPVDANAVALELRAAGVEALDPYPGPGKPFQVRCINDGCPGRRDPFPTYISSIRALAKRRDPGCGHCRRRRRANERRADMIKLGRVLPMEVVKDVKAPTKAWCMRCWNVLDPGPRLDNIRSGSNGCHYCSGRDRVPEEQAVAEMLAAGARPKTPYPAVDKRWECECLTCRTVIYPQLMTVRAGSRPCKWCTGIEIQPEAARDYMINLGEVTPKVIYPGVDRPWLSDCNRCGREVTPSLHAIKNQGSKGCIHCAGTAQMDPGYAETLLRRAGAEPLDAFPGRRRRWKARCLDPACRSVCYPILSSIQRNNSAACSECRQWGFSSLAPSYVYLVVNEHLGAAKVGIMNAGSSRLDQHRRAGWTVHQSFYMPMGWGAKEVECAVLQRWRALGWPPAITDPAAMPQGGMSETVAMIDGRDRQLLWNDVLLAIAHTQAPRVTDNRKRRRQF